VPALSHQEQCQHVLNHNVTGHSGRGWAPEAGCPHDLTAGCRTYLVVQARVEEGALLGSASVQYAFTADEEVRRDEEHKVLWGGLALLVRTLTLMATL
jgi:hypothetical protein